MVTIFVAKQCPPPLFLLENRSVTSQKEVKILVMTFSLTRVSLIQGIITSGTRNPHTPNSHYLWGSGLSKILLNPSRWFLKSSGKLANFFNTPMVRMSFQDLAEIQSGDGFSISLGLDVPPAKKYLHSSWIKICFYVFCQVLPSFTILHCLIT